VRRWVKEWGFDRAQILAACDETTKSRNPSFAYLEGILQNRRSGEDGVRRAVVELLRELRPGSAQPSPEDIKRYQALRAEGFSPDLIQLAAVQCHQKNQHAFENLEWRLSLWREEGLQTAEQAEAYTRQMAGYARQLRGLFKRAGYPDRNPSPGAIKRYRTWRENHSEELIGFAAECAQSAGGSMAYMEKLLDAWQRESLRDCSPVFRKAMEEAAKVLAEESDPQKADLVLDRASCLEMAELAKTLDSKFLQGYVRLSVDVANLRGAVRVHRMGRDADFLRQALLEGGNVSVQAIAAARAEGLHEVFRGGPLAAAAELGAKLTAGGSLTAFERECDNALTAYLESARRIPFGEETVIGYLYAKEQEFTAIRAIFAGRTAGLDGETIRSRLRETYV